MSTISETSEEFSAMWSVNEIDEYNPDEIFIKFNRDDYASEIEYSLDWLNWISLSIDEDDNSIHLNISSEDPRGSQLKIHLTKNTNKKSLIYNEKAPIILDIDEVKYGSKIGLCRIDTKCLEINSSEKEKENEEKNKKEVELTNIIEEQKKYIKELEKKNN